MVSHEVLIRLVYVLSVTAMCLSTGLIVTTFYWSKIRSRLVAVKETELRYQGYVTSLEKFAPVRNISLGKGPASEIINRAVSKAVENLYNNDAHPEADLMREYVPETCIISGQTQVLKLGAINFHKTVSNADTDTAKVFWTNRHQVNDQSGLEYNDTIGHIHIAVAGLYFITSQIRTKINVSNSTQSSGTVRHCVHRISNKTNTESIVLERVNTLCEPVSTHADQTSSVGAMFQLDAHDQIYVSTSHPDALVASDSDNHVTIMVY